MNERIKELYDQCTTKHDNFDFEYGWTTDEYFDKEKFTKLIILDTIKDCRDMFMVNSVSWNLLNKNLEHFGVSK